MYFTLDNTEGYTASQLETLNGLAEAAMDENGNPDEREDGGLYKHALETAQVEFDSTIAGPTT